MKIVFFGTPDFAVPAFKSLLGSDHDVLAAVSQPDRHSGRGRKVKPCPVKIEALKAGVKVLQPEKVGEPEFIDELKKLNTAAIAVVAYGQILPPEIIHLPEFGCINIHASLLPRYRGAAPVSRAVINGDKKTGITIMLMDEGMDTGPVLLQEEMDIMHDDTAGSLSRRLSEAGGRLLMAALRGLEDGNLKPGPQTGEATYVSLMKKSDGFIRWTRSAEELGRFIRGMNPWPGAYGYIGNERYKILNAVPVDGSGDPGVVGPVTKDKLYVGTGKGLVSILEIQPSGKPAMPVHAFLQGKKLKDGDRFRLDDV